MLVRSQEIACAEQVSWVLGGPSRGRACQGLIQTGAPPVPSSPYPRTGPATELLGAPQSVSSQVLGVFFLQVLSPSGRELGSSEEIGFRILLFPPLISSLYILSAFLASSLPLTSSRTHYIISMETARYC